MTPSSWAHDVRPEEMRQHEGQQAAGLCDLGQVTPSLASVVLSPKGEVGGIPPAPGMQFWLGVMRKAMGRECFLGRSRGDRTVPGKMGGGGQDPLPGPLGVELSEPLTDSAGVSQLLSGHSSESQSPRSLTTASCGDSGSADGLSDRLEARGSVVSSSQGEDAGPRSVSDGVKMLPPLSAFRCRGGSDPQEPRGDGGCREGGWPSRPEAFLCLEQLWVGRADLAPVG